MRLVFTVTLDLTDEQFERFAYVYGHRPDEIVDAVAQHATTTLQGDTLGQYATITVEQTPDSPEEARVNVDSRA